MGRLFWKIFLGFWLAMAVIVVVTSVTLALLVERSDLGRLRSRQEARFETNAVTARHLLEQGEPWAIRDWLGQQNARFGTQLWLLDETGRDILGRRLPRPLGRVARGERSLLPHGVLITTFSTADGRTFRLLAPGARPPPGARLRGPGALGLGLPIAIIVSGLVCLAFARYLTRPIRHLQTATRALATGALDVRVQPAIGRRRDEIADLGVDFDRMAERLQQLHASQQRLLRDVSHELRTPLARLHVALGLARQRGAGVEAELDRIELEAKRLDELIGELLTVMRLQGGGQSAGSDAVDIRELLAAIVADAALEAKSSGRRVELAAAAAATVIGNRELLRRALENVVRNAVRHTARGTAVEVGLDGNGTVVAAVRDHGPGVPEDDLRHLFDPFFRVEGARDRDSGGHGLGLAIAQQAVRLHGGEIRALNAPDGGLIVELSLPPAGTTP